MRGFAGIILTLCVGPFLIIGIYGIIKTSITISSLSETEGIVIANSQQLFSDGDMAYVPVVSFQDKNHHQFTISGNTGAIPPKYNIGDPVSILLDESNPANSIINSFWELWFADILFIGISLLVLTVFYFAIPKA